MILQFLLVSDASFDEDASGSMSLDGLGSDVDGDNLSYNIEGGSDIVVIDFGVMVWEPM